MKKKGKKDKQDKQDNQDKQDKQQAELGVPHSKSKLSRTNQKVSFYHSLM